MARKEITLDEIEGAAFELNIYGSSYILSRADLENLIKNLSKDSRKEKSDEFKIRSIFGTT